MPTPLKPDIKDTKYIKATVDARNFNKLVRAYRFSNSSKLFVIAIDDLCEIIEASGNLHPQVIADRLRNLNKSVQVEKVA